MFRILSAILVLVCILQSRVAGADKEIGAGEWRDRMILKSFCAKIETLFGDMGSPKDEKELDARRAFVSRWLRSDLSELTTGCESRADVERLIRLSAAGLDDKAALAELQLADPKFPSPNTNPRGFAEEVAKVVERIRKRVE